MTRSQQELAEIDARWALEARTRRERLIETAMGSPSFRTWRNLYTMIGVIAIIFGTEYFVDDRTLRQLSIFALAALLSAGWANIEARANARRLDALTELLDLKNLRYADRDKKHL